EVAGGVGEPGDDQVAEGVALELAALEAVLEGAGPQRLVGSERHKALAQVAGGGDTERRPEAPARSAVVGHRHDGGDVARVTAGRPQRGREAVPAPEGDDGRSFGHHLLMSRCWTVGSKPRAARSLASSPAITTERCWPPVHPTATE